VIRRSRSGSTGKRISIGNGAAHPGAILATNTSGLSLATLSDALPAERRAHFCGVHFFNPPRYMHLVELIPAAATEAAILDRLEGFLVTTLGKGVVRAKDTPNFIANRVGVFSMLATIHHAERLGIGFDVVDALTGSLIGRPRSATFRTADVVGLDTFAHVVNTMKETLPDDPWHRYFECLLVEGAIAQGAPGQKTRRGVYQKVGPTSRCSTSTKGYRLGAEGRRCVVGS
jgi:3-hydroxyacyl-CoA dehydrogenase